MDQNDIKASITLLDQLNSCSVPKWGFVVMRCTYGDDDAWNQFMERLSMFLVDRIGDVDDVDAEVLARHDWSVQEDPALDGATKEVVRDKFIQWLNTSGKAEYEPFPTPDEEMLKREFPRFSYCIAVDRDSMLSVLAADFKVFEGNILVGQEAYVNIIRADDDWLNVNYPHFATFDWSQYEDEDESTNYDEGEEEIEGSRLYDVGWMKFRLFDLYTELWTQLSGTPHHWDLMYVRPGEGLALRNGN